MVDVDSSAGMVGYARRFVIVGAPRTGSTLLVDILNSSPDVSGHVELFHRTETQSHGRDFSGLLDLRANDPAAFLDQMLDGPEPVQGFKIFQNQDDAVLENILADPRYLKIVLYRRNQLAVYSSRLISTARGEWSRAAAATLLQDQEISGLGSWDTKVTFDPARFWADCTAQVAFYTNVLNQLNAAEEPFEMIEYGDLVNPAIVRRLFSRLGAAHPDEILVSLSKNNTSRIIDRFENPDDVWASLEEHGRLDWTSESRSL